MRIHTHHGQKGLLKRHLIGMIVIIVAIAAAGGFLYWYNSTQNAKMDKVTLDTFTANVKLDKVIAETKARKAAELKAQQVVAAKIAAEQAQNANSSTAGTVDSSACNTSKTHNDPTSIDVVVNKKHCIQPVTFAPGDLETVTDSNGSNYYLSAQAKPSFVAMSDAATAAGERFYLTSSYRSYGDQVSTYAYWVNTSGKAGADTYSARPGYSEHQTGLAFDVGATVNGTKYVLSDFQKTSQYTWLQAHAANYGFIQRYYAGYESITGYEAEEWHYRYVGVAVAKDMQSRVVKTLEQYWNISGGDY